MRGEEKRVRFQKDERQTLCGRSGLLCRSASLKQHHFVVQDWQLKEVGTFVFQTSQASIQEATSR